MAQKYIHTIINMALYLEKDLKYACGSGRWKSCSLWGIEMEEGGLPEITGKVTPGEDGYGPCPTRWTEVLVGDWGVCSCVFCVFLCHSVQLGAVFCDHLAFLAGKITHKQMWNSFYAQIVPIICTSITLKQIHVFKIRFLAELAVVYFIGIESLFLSFFSPLLIS